MSIVSILTAPVRFLGSLLQAPRARLMASLSIGWGMFSVAAEEQAFTLRNVSENACAAACIVVPTLYVAEKALTWCFYKSQTVTTSTAASKTNEAASTHTDGQTHICDFYKKA